MQAIVYETPKIFIPEPLHVDILQEVLQNQGCPPRSVVERLHAFHSERLVRSGIRNLLSERFLVEETPGGGMALRLTSKGRIFLQQAAAG
ncbi:MAG TPA: hypothetical protein VEI81_07920 [Methanoregula sp.]|nr:hypothetical protein [Methanoregula sp.]